jgi:hypothetical protein
VLADNEAALKAKAAGNAAIGNPWGDVARPSAPIAISTCPIASSTR